MRPCFASFLTCSGHTPNRRATSCTSISDGFWAVVFIAWVRRPLIRVLVYQAQLQQNTAEHRCQRPMDINPSDLERFNSLGIAGHRWASEKILRIFSPGDWPQRACLGCGRFLAAFKADAAKLRRTDSVRLG